jgi:hypothetical protein
MALRKWMRDNEIYDKDLEEILTEYNINDPECDFENVTQTQWDDIYRKATVERFKELKDQESRQRLEKKLNKIEKKWRDQSGILKTNIKDNMNLNKEKDEKDVGLELKKFLQAEEMWEKDLFRVLCNQGIRSEDDIQNINEDEYDEIIRQVRVLRKDELKDNNAQMRLENLLNKFEKYWRSASGIKKTNIKGGKGQNQDEKDDAPQEKQNQKMDQNKELKKWMHENHVWEKDLFNALIALNIKTENDLKNIDEPTFDDIVRKVRVERFSAIKDQATRTRLDNLLTNFEKEWRKLSGIKKTAKKKKIR